MKVPRLGILGDGQLAKMLLEAAYPLGISPLVYSESSSSALNSFCPNITRDLSAFMRSVDVVVFESEFFKKKDLEAALPKDAKVAFLPSLETMHLLRDKLTQKKILQALRIPTSQFIEYDGKEDLETWLTRVSNELKTFVLKWGQMGYDGKGVFFPSPKNSNETLQFCRKSQEIGVSLFAEKKVSFKNELAITACYSTQKEFLSYPLVLSIQEKGICVQVEGPAVALGVNKALEKNAIQAAKKLAKHLNLFGSFSIEFFQTRSGELLVNELAPRVHNSAHYTQDAALTSQFENHLRAVLGMKLGETKTTAFFSMLNLLGPDKVTTTDAKLPKPNVMGRTHLHWYGKAEIKPGRKIGHLNALSPSLKEKGQVLSQLKKIHKEWVSLCQKECSS